MESLVEKFEHFLATLQTDTAANPAQVTDATKHQVLVIYFTFEVFEYISHCEIYTSAIKTLKDIYVKQKSDIFSRHLLQARKENQGESLDQHL